MTDKPNAAAGQALEKRWVWYEEYAHCSCSFIAKHRRELLGYCPRHGTERKRLVKLPGEKFKESDYGYAGIG